MPPKKKTGVAAAAVSKDDATTLSNGPMDAVKSLSTFGGMMDTARIDRFELNRLSDVLKDTIVDLDNKSELDIDNAATQFTKFNAFLRGTNERANRVCNSLRKYRKNKSAHNKLNELNAEYLQHLKEANDSGNFGETQLRLLAGFQNVLVKDGTTLLNDDEITHIKSLEMMLKAAKSVNDAKSDAIKQTDMIAKLTGDLMTTMGEVIDSTKSILAMVSSFGSVIQQRPEMFSTASQQAYSDSTDDDEDDNDNGGGSGGGTGLGAPASNKRKRVDDTADGGGASAAAAAEEPTGYGWLNHAKFLQSVVNDDENPLSKK